MMRNSLVLIPLEYLSTYDNRMLLWLVFHPRDLRDGLFGSVMQKSSFQAWSPYHKAANNIRFLALNAFFLRSCHGHIPSYHDGISSMDVPDEYHTQYMPTNYSIPIYPKKTSRTHVYIYI